MLRKGVDMNARARCLMVALLALCCAMSAANAEDGYDLWLRYRPLAPTAQRQLQADITGIVATTQPSPLMQSALAELARGIGGLSGKTPPRTQALRDGSLVIGTAASTPAHRGLATAVEGPR